MPNRSTYITVGAVRITRTTALCGVLCGLPRLALAQSDGSINTGDTAWILVSAALVMLMTPGLALFYGGMVRARNVLNMLMQSYIAIALITMIWALCGYSLAFSPGIPLIGGFGWLGLRGVGLAPNEAYAATIPHQAFMVYQLMFAIITPALISGAIADRMRFSSYTLFIGLWSLLVYVPLAHMVWGVGGFLRNLGVLDFAGGSVVHISSGVSALILAMLLGVRRKVSADDMRPHNLPITVIGTGVLWFGWFGFNAGSALAANAVAVSAMVATHFAAASAALVWVFIEWIAYRQPTALGFMTGAVAGLVAITPASGFVHPISAIAIGALVAPISFGAIRAKARFGYDDALDVFGVHGVGGIFGALATGLFASTAANPAGANGLFYGAGAGLLVKQLVGIMVTVALAGSVTYLLGLFLRGTIGLRVSTDEEDTGLDLALHGEAAYGGMAMGSEAGSPVGAVHTGPTIL